MRSGAPMITEREAQFDARMKADDGANGSQFVITYETQSHQDGDACPTIGEHMLAVGLQG